MSHLEPPRPGDPYRDDPLLREYLARLLPAPDREAIEGELRTLGELSGGRLYDLQLAALYREPLSAATLKQRDLLRRLDVVGLRFGEAADILSDAAIKRAES